MAQDEHYKIVETTLVSKDSDTGSPSGSIILVHFEQPIRCRCCALHLQQSSKISTVLLL